MKNFSERSSRRSSAATPAPIGRLVRIALVAEGLDPDARFDRPPAPAFARGPRKVPPSRTLKRAAKKLANVLPFKAFIRQISLASPNPLATEKVIDAARRWLGGKP